MVFIKRYAISSKMRSEVFEFLNEYEIKYEYHPLGNTIIVLIEETDPRRAELDAFLEEFHENVIKKKLPTSGIRHGSFFVSYKKKYSKKEMNEAEWFWFRSLNKKIEPINYFDFYEHRCEFQKPNGKMHCRHIVQTGLYQTRPKIKIGKNKAFISVLFCNGNELFCEDSARKLIEKSNLKGFRFDPILNVKTKEPLEGYYQIRSPYVLPDGCITAPLIGSYVCPECGITVLGNTEGSGCYDKELFPCKKEFFDPSVDLYETLPIFEYGWGGDIRYIVSRRVYELLKENKMDRALEFIPVTFME